MKIYRVESAWSKELVRAKNITEAIARYEKSVKKIDSSSREVTKVEFLGDEL